MSRLTLSRALTLASFALAATLAACGKTGELQRPPPLFGTAKAEPADQDRAGRNAGAPVRTIDPRTRRLDTSPSRANPLDGASPDPIAPGPQGAMGSPNANPQ